MGNVRITVELENPPMVLEQDTFESDDPIHEGMYRLGELHRQYGLSLARRSEIFEEGNFVGYLLIRWQDEQPFNPDQYDQSTD